MEVLPDQEEDSTSSAMLSDEFTEIKNSNSKEDNNGDQPDRALERAESTRESSSCTGLPPMSNNGQERPSALKKALHTKPTTLMNSATKNMSKNYSTHHSNTTIILQN